jgi:hypothetical protein
MTDPSSPLISIVIPTRDRPEFAALAVQALCRQSFQDFEVILSDNAIHRPFEPSPRLFDGVRFRYVRAPKPLWMTDHYEFAVGQARGRYVGVLGDKSQLVPGALEQVAAEITRGSPDAVSWRVGVCQPSGNDLAGPCVVAVRRAPDPSPVRVPAVDVLEYLLATYLDPGFEPDHQMEIRGSIYHGVFSAELIGATKARFGRVFRFYAPDLNAQCAAMQIAHEVSYIRRCLELTMAGPSNGVDVSRTIAKVLSTQEEAARGASGASPRLIPQVSTSIAHVLASDLVAVSGRTLRPEQWVELHGKVAYDLYGIGGWPDRSLRQSELAALWRSASRFGVEAHRRALMQKWNARRSNARRLVAAEVRSRFGTSLDGLRWILGGQTASVERRSFERLVTALEATATE